MLIISFAWTTDALLGGRKDVTRRDWTDEYAARFKMGDLVQAYDKSPRCGGKPGAIIRTKELHREPLSRLVDDPAYGRSELIREGNLWPSVPDFIAQFGDLKNGHPFRFEFKLEEIIGAQTQLPLQDPVIAAHAEFCRITGQQLRLSIHQGYWKALLHTHGFTPADVALTARHLVRLIKQGKKHDGHLKLHNFANPVYFNADLEIARKAQPKQPAAPKPILVETPVTVAPEDVGQRTAANLAAFRRDLRGGPKQLL